MCFDLSTRRCSIALGLIPLWLAWAFCLDGALLQAAEPSKPEPAAAGAAAKWVPPPYPRVSLSTWYKVDPNWPQRPENMPWAGTPGVAVDAKDQVWVFTRANPPVQVYTAEGKFVRAWGSDLIGVTPTGMSSHGIEIDSQGMIWLVDAGQHVVLQCTPEGKLLKTLGTRGEPGCDETHFNRPTDVAITPDGEVFVSDGYGNSRVVHFDSRGKFVKAWGKLGTGPGEFSLVHAVALDSKGRVYVADRNNARVQVFDPDGKFLAQWQNLLVPWGRRDLDLRLVAHAVARGRPEPRLPAQGPALHAVRHDRPAPPALDRSQGRRRRGAARRFELGPRHRPGQPGQHLRHRHHGPTGAEVRAAEVT